jgi:hypothetical protein
VLFLLCALHLQLDRVVALGNRGAFAEHENHVCCVANIGLWAALVMQVSAARREVWILRAPLLDALLPGRLQQLPCCAGPHLCCVVPCAASYAESVLS